jgi:hypothetical protein
MEKFGIHWSEGITSDGNWDKTKRIIVVENLLKFSDEWEFTTYKEFCSMYDNGASHSLEEIDFETYSDLKDSAMKAVHKRYQEMEKEGLIKKSFTS